MKMNKIYRFLVWGFVAVSFLSFILGLGYIQTILISLGLILFLAIIAVGAMKSVQEEKSFWWGYFKPNFAVPITWGLLHLILVLIVPGITREIWMSHRLWLIAIELSVVALNPLLNKNIPFEKRFTRILLSAVYSLLLVLLIGSLYCKLFYGRGTADFNRAILAHFKNSKVEKLAFDIERNSKEHRFNLVESRLEELLEKSKEGSLSDAEIKELQRLREETGKIYPASIIQVAQKEPKQLSPGRFPQQTISGTIEIPAGTGKFPGTEDEKLLLPRFLKNTEVFFRSDLEESAFLWSKKRGRGIKITTNGINLICRGKNGNSFYPSFLKQKTLTRVSYTGFGKGG